MGERILSSLPLQVLLFFNAAFAVFFFTFELLIFIYKGNEFLYADGVLGLEIFFLFLYAGLEKVRLFQASKGNKMEQVGPLLWSLLFAVGVVVIHVFFFQLQTYVLRIERILNGIGFVFVGFEILLMLFAGLSFYRDSSF